jgi:hypothetical protein
MVNGSGTLQLLRNREVVMQSNRCQSLQSQVSTNSANLIIKKISTFVTDPHSIAQNQLSGSKLWEVRAFNN